MKYVVRVSSSGGRIRKTLQALTHPWAAMQMRSTRTMERGLNSGVMLADLARMRKTAFSAERDDIMATWGRKGALPWGDQDVLNVYLNGHRDQAYVLPCKSNVRCAALLSGRALDVKGSLCVGAASTRWRGLRLQPLAVLHDLLKAARGLCNSLTIHLWPESSSVVLLFKW